MIVNDWVKYHLALRRETRRMKALGFEVREIDLRLHNGDLHDHHISDVAVSADGKRVWYRTTRDSDRTLAKVRPMVGSVNW